MKSKFLENLRHEAVGIPESGIVAVMNRGRNRQGLIPLWVGEGDMPTPDFICDAAKRALSEGETFYTYQRGIPELRQEIAAYMTKIYGDFHGEHFSPERFFVTIGGMHALQIAFRMVAGNGNEVLVPSPAWPNFTASITSSGAQPVQVPMIFEERHGAPSNWYLDFAALRAAITPNTRAIIINSPSNPTGWTATREDLMSILALAREHGIWIIADEIYGRITYDGARAPSFHDVMEPDDLILFAQTLSKNWAMTGWRVGWLEAPAELGHVIENLVQFTTSGVPVSAQRAAIVALRHGEELFQSQLRRWTYNRNLLCDLFSKTPGVHFSKPHGGLYLFCRFDAEPDTLKLALQLIEEANVGVAPGSTFGLGAENYVRICFARNSDDMKEAARRLQLWVTQHSDSKRSGYSAALLSSA